MTHPTGLHLEWGNNPYESKFYLNPSFRKRQNFPSYILAALCTTCQGESRSITRLLYHSLLGCSPPFVNLAPHYSFHAKLSPLQCTPKTLHKYLSPNYRLTTSPHFKFHPKLFTLVFRHNVMYFFISVRLVCLQIVWSMLMYICKFSKHVVLALVRRPGTRLISCSIVSWARMVKQAQLHHCWPTVCVSH